MSAPALRITGLCAHAGDAVLLADVDVSVPPGRILAVLGESGAGKSTLGLAALGECASGVRLEGSVEVGGVPLLAPGSLRDRRRGRVGHLPQHPGAVLDPVRRVGAVLDELAATVHGRGRAARAARETAVGSALDAARLPTGRDLRRRFPHQLSGGQQQRMALAQTLVTAPDVIVLDEPTTGLDPVTTEEVVANLAALARSGTALVLLTHDVAVARALADDALVLHAGSVVGRSVPDARHEGAPAREVTAAAAPRLAVRDLAVRTGRGEPLLHGVDVAVGRGECLAVVGRSGAGKTSFARALAGLITPWRGTVTVDGRRVPPALRDRDRTERRLVQYVHQDARSSFLDHRSVHDQVARPAVLLRGLDPEQARTEADELLDRLGVDTATRRRRPAALSGGQLQRAAVARALTARPAVLVCDEVTSALGRRHQLDLLAAIDQVRHEGDTTVVLVSHDLELVGAVADHVAVLDDGHLSEHATVADLWAHPGSTAGARLVGAVRDREPRAADAVPEPPRRLGRSGPRSS